MRYPGLYILFVLRNSLIKGQVSINDAGSFHGKVSSVLLPRHVGLCLQFKRTGHRYYCWGIALPILDPDARKGPVVSPMPWPLYRRERDLVRFVKLQGV